MTTLLPPVDLTAVAGPVRVPETRLAHGDRGLQPDLHPDPGARRRRHQHRRRRRRRALRGERRQARRRTGHRPRALSDLDDTVLVTTRRMTPSSIDPVARTARVAAGVRWRAVIDAAAEHGLAPLSGSSSQVGVVGYTTGGGLGPLCSSLRLRRRPRHPVHHRHRRRRRPRRLAESTDPDDVDLFWAVRGGKGSFGIVTELEFGLVPVTTVPRRRDVLRGRGRRRGAARLARVGAHAAGGHDDVGRAAAPAPRPRAARAAARPVRRGAAVHPPRRARAPRCSPRCGRPPRPIMDAVADLPFAADRRRAHGPDRADARVGPRRALAELPAAAVDACWRRRAPASPRR